MIAELIKTGKGRQGMNFQKRYEDLKEFVRLKHDGQIRKYTGGPYYEHLEDCFNIAGGVSLIQGYIKDAALCHDLFEDTPCTFIELYDKLLEIGYGENTTLAICEVTQELTDVYTPERYPMVNRAGRKKMEALRLGKVSQMAATVKCADIVSNLRTISDMYREKPKFAKTYMREMKFLLSQLRQAEFNMFLVACEAYLQADLTIKNMEGGF